MPANRRPALRDVLAAIYGLANVAATLAVAAGGVHQGQPSEDQTSDYVTIEWPSAERWDSMQENGEKVTFQLTANTFGPDAGNGLAIRAVVIPLIDNQRPVITANHLCVVCRWLRSIVPYKDPDTVNGQIVWRTVDTYEVLVEQVS